MKEVTRVKADNLSAADLLGEEDEWDTSVVSMLGTYMITWGTAKKTSMPGLTAFSTL